HQLELTFRLTDAPTAQERVFGHLLAEVEGAATESDLRGALDLPKTTTHVALAALVEQGLVAEERVGRTGLYSVRADDPLVRALKQARAIRRVQEAVAPIEDLVDLVVLFGSASRGEDRPGSDVDVLVVTRDKDTVLDELARHPWLQPVVLSADEHMAIIAEDGTFARATAAGTVLRRRA
ncbi:MAG: winged helix DNA-binding protein, partial [Actinobacteria bacterium]